MRQICMSGSMRVAPCKRVELSPEYEAAIALNRNLAGASSGLAWCKLNAGSIEQVIPLAEQAIRLSLGPVRRPNR